MHHRFHVRGGDGGHRDRGHRGENYGDRGQGHRRRGHDNIGQGHRGRGHDNRGQGYRGRGRGGRGQGNRDHYGGQGQGEQGRIYEGQPDGQNQGQGVGPGRGRGMRQRGHQIRKLTFKHLLDLKAKDPSDIVMELSSVQAGFVLLLKNRMSASMIRIVTHLLATACNANSARIHLFEILTTVQQSTFLKETVTGALSTLPVDSNAEYARADREFIKNILTLLHFLSSSFPHSIVLVSGLQDVLRLTIDQLQESANSDVVDDEILEMMTDLDGLKAKMFTKIRTDKEEQKKAAQLEMEPPDDFHLLSVFPTLRDIYPDKDGPYLRKIRATGGYRDLNEYLDIQFRLLREDFISPLREGIDEYLHPKEGRQRIKDIRVYNDVRILRTVCARRGLLHRLEFDVSKLKRVRWENTKRLIFGSLVCLSHDNFHTYFFATVSERDPKLLDQGIVDVYFEDHRNGIADLMEETRFVMVETTAYFEAYRHVLKGLQEIREGQLPFENYIIACDSDVQPPKYLRNRRHVQFDLRPLVDEDIVLREDDALRRQQRIVNYQFSPESRCAEGVEILDLQDWPRPEQLHLDQSQYDALQRALTKEFVVTQGPPGTGKTYVGLKIVKALLHNANIWNSGHQSPMLIVCYTNHALDQFLEGIDSFFNGNIIRVGGRASEEMSKHSLKVKKQELRKSRDMRRIAGVRFDCTKSMMEVKLKIERSGAQREASEREILHEDMLRPFMGDFYDQLKVVQFPDLQQEAPSMMVEWLGLEQMFGETQVAVQQGRGGDELQDERENDEELGVLGEAEILQQQRQLYDIDDDPNPIQELEEMIKRLPQERSQYVAFDITNFDKAPPNTQLNDQFQMQKKARKKMKRTLLKRLRETERMSEQEMRRIRNIWTLPMVQKWKLYRAWVHALRQQFQQQILTKETEYRQYVDMLAEINLSEDKQVLRTATVIGMTTTGAARYQKILSEIKPRIIVVEEAAEVLEGHVITTLSQGCEHLILIGDHKQLKPNPNVYKLATKYCLDLSLFERMINNGVPCDTLEIQHRMRPEISSLMTHIYPSLKDDESVMKYPSVMGVSQNLFFLTHSHHEKHDMEMVSHSNEFEAAYIKELCLYLLKQGYDRSQITVLTTYSGQLLVLKKIMPKEIFGGVRVTVVDNFQGEENDIILLSLVRSNDENSVGFLKIDNRICVALSRAKHGLFVIGNFDLLSENSPLWKSIVRDCRAKEQIGRGLKLFCQNHPKDAGFVATKAEDFKNAPEGGCMKPCEFRLECGHVCVRPCHPYDREHEEYKCNKPCTKVICENKHACTRRCFQECGKCTVKMEKVIPKCQHKQMVECHMDPAKFLCQADCSRIMACGHKCGVRCGAVHQCTALVKKTFKCGHSAEVRCERQHTEKCTKRCSTKLACGHDCRGNCQVCYEGRLHKSCSQKCSRILVCGHACESTCSNCPPCQKICENRCPHSKCFKKCGELCVPCMEPCDWVCRHRRCTKKCSEPCNRDPCNQPCQKLLRCDHQCIGMCGEPCPKVCRICNEEEVTAIFFGTEDEPDARFVQLEDCGHVVEVTGLDHWMQSQTHTDGSAEQHLQLKACPICKTVIRQNMRYGKQIRERLQDIEQVKKRVLGHKDKIRLLRLDIDINIKMEFDPVKHEEKQEMYERGYKESESGLTAVLNQLEFLKKIENQIRKFKRIDAATPTLRIKLKLYLDDLERFRQWFLKKSTFVLSEQEVDDAQRELDRYTAALGILNIEKTLKDRNIKLDSGLEERFVRVIRYVDGRRVFTPERRNYVKKVVEEIKKLAPESGLGISEEERVSIVKAMEMSSGHWFKCKNGEWSIRLMK